MYRGGVLDSGVVRYSVCRSKKKWGDDENEEEEGKHEDFLFVQSIIIDTTVYYIVLLKRLNNNNLSRGVPASWIFQQWHRPVPARFQRVVLRRVSLSRVELRRIERLDVPVSQNLVPFFARRRRG